MGEHDPLPFAQTPRSRGGPDPDHHIGRGEPVVRRDPVAARGNSLVKTGTLWTTLRSGGSQ